MSSDRLDPVTRDRDRNIEMRAAIDVLFEALSHIQASLEEAPENERMESYRTFKEALYKRFEYLIEKRGEPLSGSESGGDGAAGAETGETMHGAPELTEKDDTMEKLWPAIAKGR